MKTVSESYLLGIREGRELFRSCQQRGENIAELAPGFAANAQAQLSRGFGPEMSALFRGERDFWRQQIRKLPKN